MKRFVIVLCLSMFVFVVNAQLRKIVASGASVDKIADGFGAVKGSAVDKQGNVYFSDQPNDIVHIWTIDGKLEKFGSFDSAHGLHFDNDGRLLISSWQHNQLWSVGNNGSHTILVDTFNSEPLNGPGHVWVNSKTDGVYFTDPHYRHPQLMRQEGQYVYFIKPNCNTVFIADTEYVKPDGIVGTPNGKKLYVSDIVDNKTYVYDIMPDGTLANRKLFASKGSDGMTIDRKGNVYLTGRGVTIYNSKGKEIGLIKIPGWTSDVAFGGKNKNTLYITASQGLYSLKMRVKGVK